MKNIKQLFFLLLFPMAAFAGNPLEGAWKTSTNRGSAVLIVNPGYFSYTVYNQKSFVFSYGGRWTSLGDGKVSMKLEFHTEDKDKVGKEISASVVVSSGMLISVINDLPQQWVRIDEGQGPLSGDWRISSREQEGKMNAISPSARKTVKMLSGTRFQWIAINSSTGDFFGTGGGVYSFKDGTYTENIEFFSRDSSRVGASLSFKGRVEGKNWDHSGLSSKGEPIHEIWTRQ